MGYLDDIATSQSENLGVGIDYLKSRGVAWVLYKWDIKIHKYPIYGEVIKIKTAPHSFNKFYAYRWFKILGPNGEKIATANSQWLFINTKKKRPMKISSDMYETYGIRSNTPFDIENIKPLSTVDFEREFYVRYSDIDTNQHVNNVKYALWAFETLPLDILKNYTLENLKVTYKKETTYGKTVKAQTQIVPQGDDLICTHGIFDEDENSLCLLKSKWTVT